MKATFPRLARWLTSQVSVLFTWSIVACVAPPAHALDLGLPGGGSSCDPTKMSCVPGGGGGSGGGICALFPDKPECKPGGGGGGGGTCTVPPGGSPTCGGSGPASTGGGGSAGVSVGGGNPINLISGNKYQEETDLAALPGVLGLELKRYYNSLSSHSGIAGPQWRLSYETVLYDLGSQIQILQADGRRLSFAKSLAKGAGSGLCTSPQLADGQVRIEQGSDGKPVYHWRWADGRTLTFMGGTAGGFPLHRISAPTGEQLQLRYNPLGDLVAVTDPQGRSLSFLYGRAGPGQRAPLESVDTPLGRIRYAHDKLGRLTEAAFLPLNGSALGKATLTRLYHYEEAHQAGNSFALTGISLRAPGAQDQRLSTYAYETSGAAILTTRGRPQARDDKGQVLPGTGIEQLQVRYEARPLPQEGAPDRSGEVQPRSFGRIVLTNALGQATVLRSAVIAGQLRLIDSRGAGCSTCGPANVSYGYDREGRLIRSTQLSPEGTPLRAELRRYDAWGRLAETSIQAYEKGKPQAPQWTQRLAYRDQRFPDGSMALGQQPVRIEQPSVIAGKTRATEIDYNDKGQVLRITERGWSPIDAEGKEVPTAIERSTRYAYTTIAGKSLLTEIDGPLPNGPKGSPEDSDITRVEWDAKGLMPLRMRHPAGLSTEWAYLSDGRLERLKDMDGLLSRYSYAPDGGLSAIDRAGVVQRFSRDLQQGIYTSLAPNGQRLSFQFDPSGQLRAVWDGANHRIEMQRDGDGHLAQARLLNPDGSVSQTRSWASDAAGTQGAAGRDTMVDSLEGLIRNADQVRNLARPDPWQGLLPADRLQELVAQARFSDAATGPRRAQDTLGRDTLNWLDDFGQLRRVDSPTTGTSRYAYDAAGRLLSRTDQLGNTARYERDAIGRVLRVQARNAQGQLEEDAQIAWGPHNKPSRIRSLHSDESFAYDAGGRLTRHEQTVDGHRWTLAYAHDANGQLVGKTLPDGRQLDYRYRGSQHPQAGLLESIWLKGWMDRPLVYGMNEAGEGYAQRQFHFGNGLSNERLLDAQGRVSRAGTPELGQTQLRYDGDASEPSTVETRRTTRLGEAATAGTAPPWAARLHAQMARWRSLPSDPAPQPSWVQAVGDRDFEAYDALGRQLSRGDLRLRYDSLNRLVEVSKAQGDGTQQPVANYRYNLFGQRTAKAVSQAGSQTARTTYFFHDGSQLVAEADATGSVQRQYVWVNDKPVALLEQGQVLHIHTDHRNAPVALSDAAKRVVWQAEVEAFLAAGPLGSGPLGALSFNLRGSNQYFDAETGLHYNTHRYYDAQAHRYLTPDPLGLAVGPDLYAFALNRPHSMQDPLGLAPTPGKDWSKASYEDKLKEIIERAAPKLPGEIGDALLELVQPANLATMGAIFALWAGAQFTPVGWVADLALLGMGIWYAGSGVLDLYKVFSALHADTKAAKCDSDIDAAASKLAKGFVTASGELAGGLSGTWGIAKSGGLTRIAKGIRTVVDFGKRQLKKLAPPPSAAITRPGTAGAKYGPDSKYKTPDGKWNYPPDNGFTGTKTKGTLPKDTVLDRYGNEGGSFLSPQGTPFEMRALPPSSVSDIYNVYKIKKPLPVEAGKIAPAFDQPGGGTQYLLDWAKIAADNGTTIDIIRSYSSPTGKGGIAWLAEVGGYFERLTPPGGIPP